MALVRMTMALVSNTQAQYTEMYQMARIFSDIFWEGPPCMGKILGHGYKSWHWANHRRRRFTGPRAGAGKWVRENRILDLEKSGNRDVRESGHPV